MRELEDRFRSLDRIEPPDLWIEAVMRAAEPGVVQRRPFSRAFVLLAGALLLAALVGAIAVGARLIRPAPDLSNLQYANRTIIGVSDCELVGIDPMTNERRVLAPSPPDCSPAEGLRVPTATSSDGRLVAYVVSRNCGACFEEVSQEALDGQGAWIYDMTTGVTRQLEPCPERYCEEIDISPDGSLVAYIARANSKYTLVVVDVASGRSTRTELVGEARRLRFAPDGDQIALAMAGASPGLYSADVDGSGVASELVLLHAGEETSNLAWSPDGAWIALHATASGRTGIWVVRSDGTDARLVATGRFDGETDHLTWSPDGTRIAYVETTYLTGPTPAYTFELWTADIEGGEPSQIYDFGCCISDWKPATWSPDGEYIAFGFAVDGASPGSGLAIIRPDGTDLQFISKSAAEPDWQPLPIPPAIPIPPAGE